MKKKLEKLEDTGTTNAPEVEVTADSEIEPEIAPAEPEVDITKTPEPVFFYKKQIVTRIDDKLINGRLYKEVAINSETAILNMEEFTKLVTTKK